MRASVSVMVWSFALGLILTACSSSPDAEGLSTAPAAADSPSTLEPSQEGADEPGTGPEESFVRVETEQAAGLGVVVTADGYVLASVDVVNSADGGLLDVVFPSGEKVDAEIVGRDPQSRLAVVRADGVQDLTPAVFGRSDAVEVDDEVRLSGGPMDPDQQAVGVVRAIDRIIDGSVMIEIGFETTAPVGGAPLINSDDEIVGILMTTSTTVGGDELEIGYAVPSDVASRIATELIETGRVVRPYLGVQVGETEGGGALVHEVIAESPADEAGLRAGDVINRLGDEPIDGPDALVFAVQSSRVGDELRLTYTRDGAGQEIIVVLGDASSQ